MRAPLPVLGLAAVAIAVAVVTHRGDSGHRLTLVVPEASGVIAGNDVKTRGRDVGSVQSAEATRDGHALIELRIDDADWPVPVDSRLLLHLNGTIKFSDRYISLDRGTSARTFPDGAVVPAAQFKVPTEFDAVFKVFDRRTRADLRATLDAAGPALGGAGPALHHALGTAPPALAQATGALADLTADDAALRTLVSSTDRVVAAAHAANPGIDRLLAGAQTTFAAFAAQSDQLKRAVDELPATLGSARVTLARARPTLTRVDELTTRLAPGVREGRRAVGPLVHVLDALDEVGPEARSTLVALRHATPSLNSVLTQTQDLLPTLTRVGDEAAKQLNCIRPYAPEIAGFGAAWGTGFFGLGDRKDKVLRATVAPLTPPNVMPISAGALHRLLPAVGSSFPRPPGELVHQTYAIPECGYTEANNDPAKDPEAAAFDPLSKKLLTIQPPVDPSTRKAGR